MLSKKVTIKIIEAFEKAVSNVRNADKTTLWTVIIFLSLSIFIDKTSPASQLIINIPQNNINSQAIIKSVPTVKVLKTGISNELIVEKQVKAKDKVQSKFKYCHRIKQYNPNPFEKKEDDIYIFVIDEKTNEDNKKYVQVSYWSDYDKNDINTKDAWWYEGLPKIECTPEIIAKNTKQMKGLAS